MAYENNNDDLRPLILTNGLGNQMLDMVAPIYDRSKVALYLFQALGITLEKETEFFTLQFPVIPDRSNLIDEIRIEFEDDGDITEKGIFRHFEAGGKIFRVILSDNKSGLIYYDECIEYSELEPDKQYYADCKYQLSYRAYTRLVDFVSGPTEFLSFMCTLTEPGSVTLSIYEVDHVLEDDEKYMDNFISQIFIQTATWGIPAWEKEYGITPDPSWSLEQRRQNIITALQYRAPITPKKLADRIAAILDIPVKVVDNVGPNTFEVILGKLILDYSKAIELIDRIAPAHLFYGIHVEEEEVSNIGNYYKILTTEMEAVSVEIRYTVLTDENDILLLDDNDYVLTI